MQLVSNALAQECAMGGIMVGYFSAAEKPYFIGDINGIRIHHRNADRVRSHVFLCLLAYYVEWHMRSVLKSVLFDDEEPSTTRPDPVAPKEPSRSAKAKARTKRTPDAQPVHSFQSLLEDLATITRNTIVPAIPSAPGWDQDTEPTPLQKKILDLLGSLTNQ